MKVVFAGPSLPDAAYRSSGVQVRGPAASGDVAKAAMQGATVVGLIDGFFENVASVWHKEILFALSQGVQVFGAASMGALRAAECAPYGMVGIGDVFSAYATGAIVDDDAVGQVHGPEELGYVALSEPLVNIAATLDEVCSRGLVDEAERAAMMGIARRLFFKDRSYANLIMAAGLPPDRGAAVAAAFRTHRRDVKREDALALMARVTEEPDRRLAPPQGWTFRETQMWTRLCQRWAYEIGLNPPAPIEA